MKLPSLGLVLNIVIRAAIIYFLAEVLLNQGDPRFAEKAIPLRNLIIIVSLSVLFPLLHFLKKKWKSYPFWFDNLYLSIFLLDMAGNSFNLYDTYYYFDLIPHFYGPGALSVVLVGLFGLPFLSAVGVSSIIHTLFEAQEYYTDVIFRTKNVRGVFDIANDLTAGIIGSFIFVGIYLFLKRRR